MKKEITPNQLIYPGASEYEDAIALGKKSFKTLNLTFEMSDPNMRLWTFGAGQFAVAFKAKMKNKYYAVRCFQHATEKGIAKYKILSNYLKKKKIPWLSSFQYFDNEIIVGDKEYPVLLMDWVEGVDMHEFITENLYSNYWLLQLQKALVSLSLDLEKEGIGHGDIQKGNVVVVKDKGALKLKLIDYDGMYVADMAGDESIELGKPDVQHPKRDKTFFNEKMDRFSIWLILTAIEALKYDKSLWDRISDGGFNDESNFIFSFNDLNNTINSKVFAKLSQSTHDSVKEYAGIFIKLCNEDINKISQPELFKSVKKEKIANEVIEKSSSSVSIDKKVKGFKDLQDLVNAGLLTQQEFDKITKLSETPASSTSSDSFIKVSKSDNITSSKKTGKEFDVQDKIDQNVSKKKKSKKGGKEFDVEDKDVISNSEKLVRAVKLKNMFAGLFVITLMLSLFLFFSYSGSMSAFASSKRQNKTLVNEVSSLNKKLDSMTSSRDSWRAKSNSWESKYYSRKKRVTYLENWIDDHHCYNERRYLKCNSCCVYY